MPTEDALSRRFGAPTRMTKALGGLLVWMLSTVSTISVASAETSRSADFPRSTMRSVFADIKELVPLSLSEPRWSAQEDRARIGAALARLEENANALERHGRDREAGFSALALNLSGDFQQSRLYFERGELEESRFFLTGALQTCIACHVRLPEGKGFPLATQLTDRAELGALSPRERAWLLMTVRRFEEALTIWEALIRDPAVPAARLDSSGVLYDYLNVAIRVRGDLARASKTLADFSTRTDLPLYLRRRTHEWQGDLADLRSDGFTPSAAPSLARGIALARSAGRAAEGPYGRDGLVQDLAAASQLVRWLEAEAAERRAEPRTRALSEKEREAMAQAYYWLGTVEARSLDGFWVNLSERHLEAAIRVHPKSETARTAYALLEESQVLGYGGSSGVHLPMDVWNLLFELRQLMGLEEEGGTPGALSPPRDAP